MPYCNTISKETQRRVFEKKVQLLHLQHPLTRQKESGAEIGHSLEFDFVVPPPHSFNSLGDC